MFLRADSLNVFSFNKSIVINFSDFRGWTYQIIKYIYSFHFDRQYQEKEKIFKKELSTLSTLLPTLHTHLVTCSAFTSSANRFEFLDLAYVRIFSWIFVLYYWISIFWESFFLVQRIKSVFSCFGVLIFNYFPPRS